MGDVGLQAVILVGGRGTRLGALTATTPKPLMRIGERTFLDHLIRNLARHGFRRVLLLAGYLGDQIEALKARAGEIGCRIDVVIEPEPAGTAGALHYAKDLLDERFLLLNGDSLLDFNYLDLRVAAGPDGTDGWVALRRVPDTGRYGVVRLDGARIASFSEKPPVSGPGLINGGVYWLHRSVVDRIAQLPASLESEVFPSMVRDGVLFGRAYDGFFIDIGVPEDLARAQQAVPAAERRRAVFLDRDGVINVDTAYPHRPDQITFVDGAIEAIKRLNDDGRYVFVVTNQAGVARGYYDEAAVNHLHGWMAERFREAGAHVDDWRYCPFHPEATVEAYRQAHPWRKPGCGMITDLMAHWPVVAEGSFLVGDRTTDLQAAAAAGLPGHLFEGGSLLAFVDRLLEQGGAGEAGGDS